MFLSWLIVASAIDAASAEPPAFELAFIGEATLRTGSRFAGTEVGGISGIDFVPGDGTYVALSDDGSRVDPARFYRLAIDLDDGRLDAGDVRVVGHAMLHGPAQQAWPRNSVDPEGVRQVDGERLYWVSEGNARAGIGPGVFESGVDGRFVREFTLPPYYRPGGGRGIRHNLAFESLALSHDRQTLFVALENALLQDGPAADVTHPTRVRVLQLDIDSGEALAEYVYQVEPVPLDALPPMARETNGLVELLAVDERHFIAVERSFARGVGVGVRLYLAGLDGADDVLGEPALEVVPNVKTMTKVLLHDLGRLGVLLDNIEAATFGPRLADGRRTLILVADNNFREFQVTQILAFALLDQPVAVVPAVAGDPFGR
ncbi:MAG: esterase-like activity of phytase family protein [Gammaproteobacteria bacterium]|nr:esterase-like activity of phytase family protein [Gammaproteobacteria bacterium]